MDEKVEHVKFGISESAILFRGPDFCKSFFTIERLLNLKLKVNIKPRKI